MLAGSILLPQYGQDFGSAFVLIPMSWNLALQPVHE
jgi:hypothetical protein